MIMLASGVPLTRSDMSAGALLIMALVIVLSLAAGIIVVFLAARAPRRPAHRAADLAAAQAPQRTADRGKEPAEQGGAPGPLLVPGPRAADGGPGTPVSAGHAH
jgi:predicted lipid-binding transport protein (Tim44 family)